MPGNKMVVIRGSWCHRMKGGKFEGLGHFHFFLVYESKPTDANSI